MDTEGKMVLGIILIFLLLMSCGVCQLYISIVSADELPPLLLEYYIPTIYNEVVLPVFSPCPTPVPGEPIAC